MKWISVNNRLPDNEDFERKIVYSKYEGICTGIYMRDYWDLDPKGDYATGGYIYEVTHWMPPPQAPEEG